MISFLCVYHNGYVAVAQFLPCWSKELQCTLKASWYLQMPLFTFLCKPGGSHHLALSGKPTTRSIFWSLIPAISAGQVPQEPFPFPSGNTEAPELNCKLFQPLPPAGTLLSHGGQYRTAKELSALIHFFYKASGVFCISTKLMRTFLTCIFSDIYLSLFKGYTSRFLLAEFENTGLLDTLLVYTNTLFMSSIQVTLFDLRLHFLSWF